MMVTFISQCEKKALKRTRRVLDAFADRIGDNTWQTVITLEGLNAVKKLLRKTASKNTAVSCHWLKSRSRSELIWVVGRKRAFNLRGHVPVNYTTKEVIMDKLPIETSHLLANSLLQPLSKHLFAVGYIALQLLKLLHVKSPKLQQAAFIAGVLHDIGKVDPAFQNWISKKPSIEPEDLMPEDGNHIDTPKKFSFENHPRHHEISWILSESLLKGCVLNPIQRQQIAHGIYWHHTKPYRKNDKFLTSEAIYEVLKKSLPRKDFKAIYSVAISVLNDVSSLTTKFDMGKKLLPVFNKSFHLNNDQCPTYKKYDDWADEISEFRKNVYFNACNNLVRTTVISADRLVSCISISDLEEYLTEGTLEDLLESETVLNEFTLQTELRRCLQDFDKAYPGSERNTNQHEAARKLAALKVMSKYNDSYNIGVLQGPAGCGKTKIALEWALETDAKKIIWICPRVQVCQGLLKDLASKEYLLNSTIEIFTGEYKRIVRQGVGFDDGQDTDESDYFSGDIVITTIDQIVNSIITHNRVTALVDVLKAHVVFDEFHELVNMPAFNLLLGELIEVKKQQGEHANTLLVSATPHYYYLEEFIKIAKCNIIGINSFNKSSYRVEFHDFNDENEDSPLIANPQQKHTFVICNTAYDAQLGYLRHQNRENSILIHSKYTKQDKIYWFDQVFESFKQEGTRKFDVLRSGPIIQASLNISCSHMVTELTCAENWLQRLGRLNRFGENDEQENVYTTVLPKSFAIDGKQTGKHARFLNQLSILQSTKAWLDFLKDQLENENTVTINHLYGLYEKFYSDKQVNNLVAQDFLKAIRKSVELINKKIMDPVSVPPKLKKGKGPIKISANSLRGDNRFVQMAECEVDETLQFRFSDHYACAEEFDPSQPSILTESIDAMRGFGDDDNNLVQFMRKKHHNIKQGKDLTKARNEWDLIAKARSPEFPIYLSYTPKDLSRVNAKRHDESFYYILSDRQPVGAMRISRLESQLQPLTTENK